MEETRLVPPHGGRLVNRVVDLAPARQLAAEAAALPVVRLSAKQACDLEMIALGAFSPLTGFVGRADFEHICTDMRLAGGEVWPIPITLAVDDTVKAGLREGGRAALQHADGTLLAVIDVQEIFPHQDSTGTSAAVCWGNDHWHDLQPADVRASFAIQRDRLVSSRRFHPSFPAACRR